VPGERIELPTNGLQNRCSTAELTRLRHHGEGLIAQQFDRVKGASAPITRISRGSPLRSLEIHQLAIAGTKLLGRCQVL
jgi:hypothetical protein